MRDLILELEKAPIEERPALFEKTSLRDWANFVTEGEQISRLIVLTPADQASELIQALGATNPSRFSLLVQLSTLVDLVVNCQLSNMLPALIPQLSEPQKQDLKDVFFKKLIIPPHNKRLFIALLKANMLFEFMTSPNEVFAIGDLVQCYCGNLEAFLPYLDTPTVLQKLASLKWSPCELGKLFMILPGQLARIEFITKLPKSLLILTYEAPMKMVPSMRETVPILLQGIQGAGELTHMIKNDPKRLVSILVNLADHCANEAIHEFVSVISSEPSLFPLLMPTVMHTSPPQWHHAELYSRMFVIKQGLLEAMNQKGWQHFINTPEQLDYALGLNNKRGTPHPSLCKKIITGLCGTEKCYSLMEDAVKNSVKFKNLDDENYSRLFVAGLKYSKNAQARFAEYGSELADKFPQNEEEIRTAFGRDPAAIEVTLNHLNLALCISLLRIMQDRKDPLVEHLCRVSDFWFPVKAGYTFPQQTGEVSYFKSKYREELKTSWDRLRHKFADNLDKLKPSLQFWAIVRHLMEGKSVVATKVVNSMIEARQAEKETPRAPSAPVAEASPAPSSTPKPSAKMPAPSAPPGGPDPAGWDFHSLFANRKIVKGNPVSLKKISVVEKKVRYWQQNKP